MPDLPPGFCAAYDAPAPRDLTRLRDACDMPPMAPDHAARALDNSLITLRILCAENSVDLAGFGRVVGDGVTALYLQDVLVHPDFQGDSLGEAIISALLTRIREIAPEGASINLMSTPGTEGFYADFGFRARPNDDEGAGMTLHLGQERL